MGGIDSGAAGRGFLDWEFGMGGAIGAKKKLGAPAGGCFNQAFAVTFAASVWGGNNGGDLMPSKETMHCDSAAGDER